MGLNVQSMDISRAGSMEDSMLSASAPIGRLCSPMIGNVSAGMTDREPTQNGYGKDGTNPYSLTADGVKVYT